MTSSLRVLHPPCSENPTNLAVLILSVDSQRYLFNLPEGLTRSLAQKGGVLKGLGNIFLPRVGIEECGGLPGMLMTLADAGRSNISIHGPPLTKHWLATCRFHLYRDSMNVTVRETPSVFHQQQEKQNGEPSVHFQDDNITIEAYTILPKGYKAAKEEQKRENYSRPFKRQKSSPESEPSFRIASADQLLRVMFPNSGRNKGGDDVDAYMEDHVGSSDPPRENRVPHVRDKLEDPLPAPVGIDSEEGLLEQAPVLVHLIRTRVIRGNLDAQKASLLGVPKGKLLGELTNGQDVEFDRPVAWAEWSPAEKDLWLRKDLNSKKRADKSKSKGQEAPPEKPAVDVEKVVVKSAEVMGASRGGAVIGQIYLPSIQYMEPFLASKACSELQSIQKGPHALIHCVHPAVLLSPAYQDFVRSLKDTQHIIVSRPFLADRLIFPSSALSSLRMHLLDKDLFPAPQLNLNTEFSLADAKLKGNNIHLLGSDIKIPVYPPGLPVPFDDLALDLEAHAPLSSDKVRDLISFQDFAGRKSVRPDVKLAKQTGWGKYVEMAKKARAEAEVEAGTKVKNGAHDTDDLDGGYTPFKVTPLGTGSANPGKYRNVSATLLHMPGGEDDAGYILLDAGESTYGQLQRKFLGRADKVIANIRMIFISHSHADHHMGLTRLLKERVKMNVQRPLFVIAPSFIRKYIYEVDKLHSLSLMNDLSLNGVLFIDAEHLDSRSGVVSDSIAHPELNEVDADDTFWLSLRDKARKKLSHMSTDAATEKDMIDQQYNNLAGNRQRTRKAREVMTEMLHGTQVYTTEVDHRATHCYGIILRGKRWSAVYSGDTRPCQNLVSAGKGVQLLIHEATIEDSEPVMARKRGHSTFGQAINVAREMGVRYVLLTHFSQRYPKLPKLTNEAESGGLKVAIAFDLLTVQLSDFDKMMRHREALEVLFGIEHEEEGGGAEVEEGGGEEESSGKKGTEKSNGKGASSASAPTSKQSNGNLTTKTATEKMDVDKEHVNELQAEEEKKQKKKDTQEGDGERRFQRKFVKSYEFQYVSFDLKPVQSKMTIEEAGGVPSRLSIARAVEEALIDLNGVVNGSFNWDLLHIQPMVKRRSIRVIIKVPSEHLETLQATLSSGLAVPSSDNSSTFLARFDRTLSSLDLVALKLDDSQDWFESMIRGT